MYTSLTGDEDEAVDNYHVSMLMLAPRRQQVNDTGAVVWVEVSCKQKVAVKNNLQTMCTDNCPQFAVCTLRPSLTAGGMFVLYTNLFTVYTTFRCVCGGGWGARLISALLQVCLCVYTGCRLDFNF